ncbi:hypothetical protein BC828DRAFT_441274 [Blastocladiella britannica]|nr:hypothetical protein BC828DRAFT_441274 [Blastocladiella britannica]
MDSTTAALAALALTAWYLSPGRQRSADVLQYRRLRLDRACIPHPTRVPGQTAIYRAVLTPPGADLARTPWMDPQERASLGGDGRAPSLFDLVASGLTAADPTRAMVAALGGPSLTGAEFLTSVLNLGAGLHVLLVPTDPAVTAAEDTTAKPPSPILNLLGHHGHTHALARLQLDLACIAYGITQRTVSSAEAAHPVAIAALLASPTTPPPSAIVVTASAVSALVAALPELLANTPLVVVPDADACSSGVNGTFDHLGAGGGGGIDLSPKPAARVGFPYLMEAGRVAARARPVNQRVGTGWVDDLVVEDATAAMAGLSGHGLRVDQPQPGQVAVVEVSGTGLTAHIYAYYLLSRGVSVHLLSDQAHLENYSTSSPVHALNPHLLVLSSPSFHSVSSQLDAAAAAPTLAGTMTGPLARQHLAAARHAGFALTWSELLVHQRAAFRGARRSVGSRLRTVTVLGLLGATTDDLTWATLAGVTVVRVWGPQAALGIAFATPVARGRPLTAAELPTTSPDELRHTGDAMHVGAVLPHCEFKIVSRTEEDAARKVGPRVLVRTATWTGARGPPPATPVDPADRGWVDAGVKMGWIDRQGELWVVVV